MNHRADSTAAIPMPSAIFADFDAETTAQAGDMFFWSSLLSVVSCHRAHLLTQQLANPVSLKHSRVGSFDLDPPDPRWFTTAGPAPQRYRSRL